MSFSVQNTMMDNEKGISYPGVLPMGAHIHLPRGNAALQDFTKSSEWQNKVKELMNMVWGAWPFKLKFIDSRRVAASDIEERKIVGKHSQNGSYSYLLRTDSRSSEASLGKFKIALLRLKWFKSGLSNSTKSPKLTLGGL
jgi:hypothetical protein